MTDPEPGAVVPTQADYPGSQEEAQAADYWRFHFGSLCPANCNEVYYRRKIDPDQVYGPTQPEMIRWSQKDESDILAWHPVFSAEQRRHRLAGISAGRAEDGGDQGLRELLREAANRLERCIIHSGSDADIAEIAVAKYREAAGASHDR